MRRTLQQSAVIILLGVGLGLAANQSSSRGLALVTPPKPAGKAEEFLALEQAKLFWQSGNALFLDAREPTDYAAGHIASALNLPAQSFERHFGEIAPLLTPESRLILYCDGTECELSHRVRGNLRQLGYTNTHLLFNGWTTWRQAGFPTALGGPP